METALAILGGIILVFFIIFLVRRTIAILKANRIMENTIRIAWEEMGAIQPEEQDNIAIHMMEQACFSATTLDQYRLALGAIRNLSPDIVKDKQKLESFKRRFILYGQVKGWTNI